MEDFLGLGAYFPIILFFVPLVVGLVVQKSASDQVKVITNMVAVALVVLGDQVASAGGVLDKDAAIKFVAGLVTSIATYYGVWKPVGAGNLNDTIKHRSGSTPE